ncbi:ATP-dependent DNA helicase PcrA [Pirellulimonas nuda]|uniref:DNA 3'-5' helicase n=1 Tax=Pirellulimonas nuda TaxID=2528009 RepID=A0A518DEZ3_9BACT|nr:UvrD-helicase domain-containing protein [Pirellulimonas nuda]QDU90049.1 ATP-dependent DNA helicase PcrA [Pirellulimonas nuda]
MPSTKLTEGLNAAQAEAVLHVDGPLLILAGPGSGKTRVVTHRIAHLLEQGVPAHAILALTFTNKAAEEMRRRVGTLAPGQRVWLSTFHRFGAKLLRKYGDYVGLSPNFTIYDAGDARKTLKRVIEAQRLQTGGYTADRIGHAISDAKNKLITADKFKATSGRPISHVVAEAYPAYQRKLIESDAVDFDDLLLHVAQMLHDNPELRRELDRQFRYVLVDEYQDTNRAQYVILRALSVDYPNLAATGDPDQSIYGWRGADIKNILEFERDYPNVKVVRLEQNYRSTGLILQAADELIAHNTQRKQKRLFTEKGPGAPVRLAVYGDQDKEASGIARQIREAIDSGERRASDFAIFYRINALSRSIERALREARVPFQMVRGQEFFQRKEIKDVLAYCQLAANPRDDVAFERTVNTPARGIGKKTIDALAEHAYRTGSPMLEAARHADATGLPARTAKKVQAFVEIIDDVTRAVTGSVEELLGVVLDRTDYLEKLKATGDEEDQNRIENIQELLTDARQFDEQSDEGGLEEYLERAWLVNETDNWENDADKVTMMTLHAAKGLEFPVAYIVALEDGILPHERSLQDPNQLEEERRLAFVGITRAMQNLQLSYVARRDYRGQRRIAIPSSFLMEMPRGQMDVVREEVEVQLDTWDADPWDAEELEEWRQEPPPAPAKRLPVDIAGLMTTAAALADDSAEKALPRVSPEVFRQGMVVVHPEFGPGKIVALSGSGKGRKATIRFAKAGERRFVLAHSPVRPAQG